MESYTDRIARERKEKLDNISNMLKTISELLGSDKSRNPFSHYSPDELDARIWLLEKTVVVMGEVIIEGREETASLICQIDHLETQINHIGDLS
jgi:hypothetical protein